jgi:hypothetical protein
MTETMEVEMSTKRAGDSRDAGARKGKARMSKRNRKQRDERAAKAEYAAEMEIQQARREQAVRRLNTVMHYFLACSSKACRRAKACAGAPFECFGRWWPHEPEEVKWTMRAMLQASREGVSSRDVFRVAREQVARWQGQERRLDAQIADAPAAEHKPVATNAPAVVDPATSKFAGPRIRPL